MDSVFLKAYAKINLALDVLGQRENGYHDVRMIMQTVGLYDTLRISVTGRKGISITTNVSYLPVNEGNLVYKAASLFMESCGIDKGVYIKLDKHIPVSAGLAGGSSDAAAALLGLNSLFETHLDLRRLQEIGVMIGADVPYCLLGGTALCEGIGEVLTPLPAAPRLKCVLVKPPCSVSTKYVYKHLTLGSETVHPDVDGMIAAIRRGNAARMCECMGNVLESVTAAEYPEIDVIRQELIGYGAMGALMSGSGPTVFGLFGDKESARRAYYNFKIGRYGKQTFLADFCGREE